MNPSQRTGTSATTYWDGERLATIESLNRLVGLYQEDMARVLMALERLAEAVRDTLCDDEPCARCDHLRTTLRGMQSLTGEQA